MAKSKKKGLISAVAAVAAAAAAAAAIMHHHCHHHLPLLQSLQPKGLSLNFSTQRRATTTTTTTIIIIIITKAWAKTKRLYDHLVLLTSPLPLPF